MDNVSNDTINTQLHTDNISSLGEKPKCMTCNKYIEPNETVTQTIIGPVKLDNYSEGEYIILWTSYKVNHTRCISES